MSKSSEHWEARIPIFVCEVIDGTGARRKKRIEAASASQATSLARERFELILSVRPMNVLDALANAARSISGQTKLSGNAHQRFCHVLASYLKAGISIQESLRLLGAANADLKVLSEEVRKQLASGRSLETALRQSGYEFPNGFLALVRTGSESGKIDEILFLEAQRARTLLEIRRDLAASLIYPVVLIVMSILVIVFMLMMIVPEIRGSMQAEALAQTSLLSQVIFGASDALNSIGALGLVIILTGCGCLMWFTLSKMRERIAKLALGLPLIGSTMVSLYAAVFCHALGTMLASSVRLELAWRLAASTIGNSFVRQRLEEAGTRLVEGMSLSAVVDDARVLPSDVVSIFGLGERTGTLPTLLIEVAEFHSGEALSRLRKISGALVPAIILLAGVLVGSFAVAMMSTLQSVNQIYVG